MRGVIVTKAVVCDIVRCESECGDSCQRSAYLLPEDKDANVKSVM